MARHTRAHFEHQLRVCLKHRNTNPGRARVGARFYIQKLREHDAREKELSQSPYARPILHTLAPASKRS